MTTPIVQSAQLTSTNRNDQLLLWTLSHPNSLAVVQLLNALSQSRRGLFSQRALDIGLTAACQLKNTPIVLGLLRHGANLETRDGRGMTPLLLSAECSMTELAKILLQRGADVNATNLHGETALILSTYPSGSAELIKLLLEHPQVDLRHKNNNGYTALMSAIEALNFNVVKLLINAEDVETTDCNQASLVNNDGESAEDIAQRLGVADLIKLMMGEKRTGVTALNQAALNRDVKSLQYLTGYNVGEQDSGLCRTLTGFINSIKGKVQSVEYDVVRILCENIGGKQEAANDKEAVIELALGLADLELIQILCSNGFVGSHKSLSTAATIGRHDILCVMLNTGAVVNTYDNERHIQYRGSPLDHALQNCQFHCAWELFKCGAKIDVKIAVSEAVSSKNSGALTYLFQQFPLNSKSAITQTSVLHEAVEQNESQSVILLLEHGANVNEAVSGKTPIMHAMDVEMIELLIQRGADVNLATSQKGTPLIHALSLDFQWNIEKRAGTKHSEGIEIFDINEKIMELILKLLEHSAKLNGVYHLGRSPLSCAIGADHPLSLIKVLVDAGADVNDSSPLHRASSNNNIENVLFLIESGAKVNERDQYGQTPLLITTNHEVIEFLIQNRADVNVENVNGDTPLILTIELCDDEEEVDQVVDILIEAGCDVNHRNKNGFSALMVAAKYCNGDIMETLLIAGADVNTCTTGSNPKTALDILLKKMWRGTSQREKCIQLLVSHGVSVHTLNPCVIHILISAGCLSLATKLISSGIGPQEVPLHKSIRGWYKSEAWISPFGVALLLNNVRLARYFFEIRYLTKSDLTMLRRNKTLAKHLSSECLQFTLDASRQTLSLETLSFIAVSSAIGSSPGRQSRLENTYLPAILQEALLYKDIPLIVDDNHEPKNISLNRSFLKKYEVKDADSSDESVYNSYDDFSSESDF